MLIFRVMTVVYILILSLCNSHPCTKTIFLERQTVFLKFINFRDQETHKWIFTGGYKCTQRRVGAGGLFYKIKVKLTVRLQDFSTVMGAKIYAIPMALRSVTQFDIQRAVIFSDCKSALKFLKNLNPSQHLLLIT